MSWFPLDKRKRLLKLLRDLLHERPEFLLQIDQWLTSPRDLTKTELYTKLDRVRKMIVEDTAIIHLLVELRRQGRLVFRKAEQDDTGKEILSIVMDLLEKSKVVEGYFLSLLNDYKVPWDIPRSFIIYQNKLRMLIDSEKKEIVELERDLRSGLTISKRRIFVVTDGKLKVELHERPHFVNLLVPLGRERYSPQLTYESYGLLVFYRDFLVAEARLAEYNGRFIRSKRVITYVREGGYIRRAIKLLLKEKRIKTWISDDSLTPDAVRMFTQMEVDPELRVTRQRDGRFEVKLAP